MIGSPPSRFNEDSSLGAIHATIVRLRTGSRNYSQGMQHYYYNIRPATPHPKHHNDKKVSADMRLKFPPQGIYAKALAIGVIIAIIGYLLFPALAAGEGIGQGRFALLLLAATVIGIVASGIGLLPAAAPATRGAEAGRKTVFVGNLAFKANRDELRQLFERYGTVYSVRIMTDRVTRRPRGFAFVEMDETAVAAAIKGLDGKEFYGRNLRVNEGSEQRPPRGEG